MEARKAVEISGGTIDERAQLCAWIAEALDAKGCRVTIVKSHSGFEYSYRRFKARPAGGFVMGDVDVIRTREGTDGRAQD